MDMQTKINFLVYKNSDRSYRKNVELLITSDTGIELGNSIVSLDEYSMLEVSIESDDPTATIEIESSVANEPVSIREKDSFVIICNCEEYEYMLPPGKYSLKVYAHSRMYEGLYEIIPSKVTTWTTLTNLREYLEHMVEGLSKNLYSKRQSFEDNFSSDKELPTSKLYIYLLNNIDFLISNLDSIIKSPSVDIRKAYKEQSYSIKQDAKSQRWLHTKGTFKNNNPHQPSCTYEKHSYLATDIAENRWIKKIALKVISSIYIVESQYDGLIQKLKLGVLNKEEVIEEEKIKLNNANKYSVIHNSQKRESEAKIKYITEECIRLKERIKQIQAEIDFLKKKKNILVYYCEETWLSNLGAVHNLSKAPLKMLKDKRYMVLYSFYMDLVDSQKTTTTKRVYNYINKQSPKLFEYYNVLMVIEILKNNGFIWEKGWIRDDLTTFKEDIPTDESMVFRKDGYRCEVTYEKEVHSDNDVIINRRSDFIRRTAQHYKPDILVALYDDFTNELLQAIIIEVKYCKASTIYNPYGMTRAIQQLRHYDAFGFYQPTQTLKRDAITKLILTYPKQQIKLESTPEKIGLFNAIFIQLEPNENINISTHIGYSELEKELLNGLQIS